MMRASRRVWLRARVERGKCAKIRTARVGSTLVELLVAVPIGAMLSAVAVMLLLDAHKLARRVNSASGITRELRHAGALLANELRPLTASDIISWTDTSVDVNATLGAGIVCGSPAANVVDLLAATPNDPTRTSWSTSPDPGDRVWFAARDTSPMPQLVEWKSATVQDVTTSATACASSPLLHAASSARPVRITVDASDSVASSLGTPVRVTRRVRYSLYKASDNQWYLGRKALLPSGWEVIQPAAGPLRTAALHGLMFDVRDDHDVVLHAPTTATPAYLNISMRSASAWKQTVSRAGAEDSLLLRIALRGQSQLPPAVP